MKKKLNDSILPTYKESLKSRTLLKRNEKLLHDNLDDIIGIGNKLKLTDTLSPCIRRLVIVIKDMRYTVIQRENISLNPKDPAYNSYFIAAAPYEPKQRPFAMPGFSPFRDSFSYFCSEKKFDTPRIAGHNSFRRKMIYLENECMTAGQAVATLVMRDIIAHFNRIVKPAKRSNK